jgi:CHAD domain-containing protein
MNERDSSGFLLPHKCDTGDLVQLLGGHDRCSVDGTSAFTLEFFDSFDWRLHSADLRLLRVQAAEGTVLRLKPAKGGEPKASLIFDDAPAWPESLPSGPLRDALQPLLQMRVLLPLVNIKGKATELRLLNDDQKTVVRLQLLHMHCLGPGVAEPRSLWPRVRLVPVRGYAKDLSRLTAYLGNELEWPRASACLFDEAITAIGREAGDYSSKLNVPLQSDMIAIDSMRKILLSLLDTLERNIPGTRADLDSEFLHDLRVATRRTRSALSQVKRVLPQGVVDEFKQRFAWLGQITGPTRDLDVFLLEMPRYRATLPAAMAGDLDAFEGRLRAAQQSEQAKLRRKLGSPEMQALLDDWHRILEAEVPPGEPGSFADLPIEPVASARIWGMYKKVLKAGRSITWDGPPEAMHELRKDCKKLRYLIEFFRALYPDEELKGLIRTLKTLLDNLGEFQDLEVQADKLKAFASEFAADGLQGLPTVMAIGALVADLLRNQQAAHTRFADCFAQFDSPENRAIYKRLFKTRGDKLG